jgi:DNA-binding response OmpR family regulator
MSKKIRIVLIEDDTDDVELLQDALNNYKVSYTMSVLKDGSAAAGFCESADVIPDIIIMDFNLPRVHGREVVNLIRCKEKFANVPILILSTSSSKEDIAYAYQAGADKYLIKPATLESIKETVRTIVQLAGGHLVTS